MTSRIGLQTKGLLVLAAIVLAVTAAGGAFYHFSTGNVLHRSDRQQADSLVDTMALAAADGLVRGDRVALQHLVNESIQHSDVHYACVVDRTGKVLAWAAHVSPDMPRLEAASQPVSLSYETPLGEDFLAVGRPVLASLRRGDDMLVGAVRLMMDTRRTPRILAGTGRQFSQAAVAIVLCAIPLGYLLVRRVLIAPIRRLVAATRHLGRGDLSVRTRIKGNDEIAELSGSFDSMAERLQQSLRELEQANHSLERKVTQRTGELERANRRLRDEMTEKEEFLRAVSHDLNAPLRNIAGMASMIVLRSEGKLPEDVSARLQRIQANVEAESGLLNELLELSRIKSRPSRRQWVDVSGLLEEIRGALEYDLKQKNIAFRVAGAMPRLWAEPNRLRQLFQNLIDNAIKYMPSRDDAWIEVSYSPEGEAHHFAVADNGRGISPEDQQRIFCVFRRAASTGDVPGKGVGLATVKTIVSNYDGRVCVQSHPGQGATFHVELPFAATVEKDIESNHVLAEDNAQIVSVG